MPHIIGSQHNRKVNRQRNVFPDSISHLSSLLMQLERCTVNHRENGGKQDGWCKMPLLEVIIVYCHLYADETKLHRRLY